MSRWAAGFILIVFALCSSYSQGQQKAQDPGELYDAGMALFHKAKYEEAIDRFSKLILFFPASKLSSYSRYMIGQCYLKMRKYEEAVQQFEIYLKAFPDGDRIHEATKGIDFSKEKLKEKASAPPRTPQPSAPEDPQKKKDEVNLSAPKPSSLLQTGSSTLLQQAGSEWTNQVPAGKVIVCRLIKNAQMQGARNPKE